MATSQSSRTTTAPAATATSASATVVQPPTKSSQSADTDDAGGGGGGGRRRRPRHCGCHSSGAWRSWYGVATAVASAALVAAGGWRLLVYTRLAWPATELPVWELRTYMALVAASVVLLPVFLVAALCRVGNLANDGVTLGSHVALCSQDTVLGTTAHTWRRQLWIHSGPTAPFLHLVMAVLLLLAKLIMEAKLIGLGYLEQDRVLSSNWPMLYQMLDRTTSEGNSTITSARDIIYSQITSYYYTPSIPSWEMINYTVALFVYALQYAACFWQTNKTLGVLFSCNNVCTVVVSLCAWDGFSVLYKVAAQNGDEFAPFQQSFLLPRAASGSLCLLTLALLLSTSAILHLYGHQKWMDFLHRLKNKYQIAVAGSSSGTCGEYWAHTAALLYLVVMVSVSSPLMCDLAALGRIRPCPPCLVAAAAILLHLFIWVLLWLLLSVKHRWTFKIRVTLGNAFLRSAEHIKLVHQVDLKQKRGDSDAPMMIVERGVVSTVRDHTIRGQVIDLVEAHGRGELPRWQQEEVYWHKAADSGESGDRKPTDDGSDNNDAKHSETNAGRLETIVETEVATPSDYHIDQEDEHPCGGDHTALVQHRNSHDTSDFSVSRQHHLPHPLQYVEETAEYNSSHQMAVIHQIPQMSHEEMMLPPLMPQDHSYDMTRACQDRPYDAYNLTRTSDGLPYHTTLISSEFQQQQQQQQQEQLFEQQQQLVSELERLNNSDDSSGFHSGSSHDTEPPQPLFPATATATTTASGGCVGGARLASMSLQRPATLTARHQGPLLYGCAAASAAVSTACTLPTRLVCHQRPAASLPPPANHQFGPFHQIAESRAPPPPPPPINPSMIHPAPEPSSLGVRVDLPQPIYRNTIGLVDSRG